MTGDVSPPAPAPPVARPPRRWVGILAVVFGGVMMVGGMVGVWLYAQRLPAPKPAVLPAPMSAPPGPKHASPFPVPAAPEVAPLAPPVPLDSAAPSPAARAAVSLPLAIAPFPEDATAVVPVVGQRPLWGGRDAFVTATIFGDLECPHTIALLRELLRLKLQKGEELRIAFRHRPLSQHAEGLRAARALAEIHATRGEQAFWHALAGIVRRGEPLEPGVLATVLDDAGLPGFPLPSPVARAEATLVDDAELATRLYVQQTPTLFVNGVRASGFIERTKLDELVERERREAYYALAGGMPPANVYVARSAKNLLNLGGDPPERACVEALDAPISGPATALVTVVEFTDLECELCRQGEAALAAVRRAHPSDVRVVWKHFPLPQHHRARLAAGVALAARKAGGDEAFFRVTRALTDAKGALDDETLARAVPAGEDAAQILGSARAGAYDASIDADVKAAEALGITGAPTYFVNGFQVSGALPENELAALIERELKLARRVRSQGAGYVAELACGQRIRAKSASSAAAR